MVTKATRRETAVRESEVETYLKRQVLYHGGLIRKIRWLDRRGAPDRYIRLCGNEYLVELKAPGKKAEPHQLREHARLRSHGAKVFIIDTLEGVDSFIKEVLHED